MAETILLVENEYALRELMRRFLEGSGYAVLNARDGDEALSVATAHPTPIDLLLTDVVMPGMNGVALATELRRAHPDLSVLYMSGYTGEAAGVYQRVQPADVLSKPFSASQLIRRVQDALQRPGARWS